MENQVDQPKPEFTIEELLAKLSQVYGHGINLAKHLPVVNDGLKESNSILQELIAIVSNKKENLDSIHTNLPTAKAVEDTLVQEKPDHYVVGVQLFENGRLVGTSLYTTVVKGRKIKDILNKKFAELRVNHEAKLVNYPVF